MHDEAAMSFHPAIGAWFEGQVSLEEGEGFLRPWRLPFDRIELFSVAWWKTWSLVQQAAESTGVRLRLKTDAPRLVIDCEPLAEKNRLFDLVIGNQRVQTASLEAGESTVDFALPAGDKLIEVWLPHNAPCGVRGIRTPASASLAPAPDDRPLLVVYGSSITHCQGAHSPARTWPGVAGRLRDLNVISLGFSGQCHVRTPVARVLRDLPASAYILKIGINICGDSSLNGNTFMPNVAGMVQLIREKHPDTPIALVSPIINPPREDPAVENEVGMSIPKFREQLAETAERLRRVCSDTHLHYFDGRTLFGKDDAIDHQPDGCHPSADGCEILGRRAAERILPVLLP